MSLNKTLIEWVKNPDGTQGYTWNSITGCLFNVNGLCKCGGFPCYAYRLAHGRLKTRYLSNYNIAPSEIIRMDDEPWPEYSDPFYPRFWPERLNIRRKYEYGDCRNKVQPRGIFCCDMSDLFGIGVPPNWTAQILNKIRENKADRFYLLTKQPQNLAKFSPFPDNCYVGVTATSDAALTLAVTNLAGIEAKVKYISFEPLLGAIQPQIDKRLEQAAINWVIIGAQTKPHVYPKIEWVREIVEAVDKVGIPVFLKDNLRSLIVDALANRKIERRQFLNDLELRQEMPNVD